MAINKEEVIAKYVRLRDELKTREEAYNQEIAPLKEQMEKIEAWFLANMNQDGVESYKTAAGTAYRTTTLSTKLENREELMRCALAALAVECSLPVDYVVNRVNESGLLEIRVAKSGIKDFMENFNGRVPPGVAVEHIVKVNVRRT